MKTSIKKSSPPIRITDYQSGKFETGSGILFDFNNPTPEMISIYDISLGLSQTIRFGGQIKDTYTVAHHSILVSRMLPERLRVHGLLHDAAEAYIGDVVKPLKEIIGEPYRAVERKIEQCIQSRFRIQLSPADKALIKEKDIEALLVESEAFQRGNPRPLTNAIGDHLPWNAIGPFMEFDHNVIRGLFLLEMKSAIHVSKDQSETNNLVGT